MKKFIHLNKKDNVVVAVKHFQKNDILELDEVAIKILDEVPAGHKIAVKTIAQRQSVVKYGIRVGVALIDIAPGEHVHIHNATAE